MTSTTRYPGWRWMASFVAFPVAGLLGRALGGPVDEVTAAVAGGAVTGAVLGGAQWLAARSALGPVGPWVGASAAGYAAGLAAGGAAVGFDTALGDLALMGAVSGVGLGAGQALVLARRDRSAARLWAAATPVLFALGWTVTSLVGVDVERQYTVFGASGALVVTALSGRHAARLAPAGASAATGATAGQTVTSLEPGR